MNPWNQEWHQQLARTAASALIVLALHGAIFYSVPRAELHWWPKAAILLIVGWDLVAYVIHVVRDWRTLYRQHRVTRIRQRYN